MSDIFSFISTNLGANVHNILSALPIGYSVVYSTIKANYQQINYTTILQSRFLEFMQSLEKNKRFFKEELFLNEHWISGLALTYSELMKQRFSWKRDNIFGIFLGFTNEENKESFELEKMYFTLNLMSLEDLETLKYISEPVFVPAGEFNKYISLNSLGLLNNPPVWGGNRYELSSFGQNFKKFVFQDLG